ncbi:MAG: hypothetical protein SNH79_06410 [Rikenellaceae bacterium]
MAQTIKYQGSFLPIVASVYALLAFCANVFFNSRGQIAIIPLALSIVLMLVIAVTLTRMTLQYNVFGLPTHLPAMLVLLAITALTDPSSHLTSVVAALLTLLAIRNLNEAFSLVATTSKIFSAAIWIGILPLIFPSAIVMLLALLAALILYERDLREYVVALIGVLTPAAIAIYSMWLLSDIEPLMTVENYIYKLMRSSNWLWYYRFDAQSFSFILALFMTLIGFLKISNLTVTSSARSRIFMAAIWCAISTLMLLIPSFELGDLVVIAPAIAVTATSALITTRWWMSIALLIASLATASLQIFW